MGALATLQNDLKDLIEEIPALTGKVHVLREGESVDRVAGLVDKAMGRAVTISLSGFRLTEDEGLTYDAQISVKVWTKPIHNDSDFYDDLAEAITSKIHYLKYPADDEQCANRVQVSRGRLLSSGGEERLSVYAIFELIVSTPFTLTIENK